MPREKPPEVDGSAWRSSTSFSDSIINTLENGGTMSKRGLTKAWDFIQRYSLPYQPVVAQAGEAGSELEPPFHGPLSSFPGMHHGRAGLSGMARMERAEASRDHRRRRDQTRSGYHPGGRGCDCAARGRLAQSGQGIDGKGRTQAGPCAPSIWQPWPPWRARS